MRWREKLRSFFKREKTETPGVQPSLPPPPPREIETAEAIKRIYRGETLRDVEALIEEYSSDELKEKLKKVGEEYIGKGKKEYGGTFTSLLFALIFKEGGVYRERGQVKVDRDMMKSIADIFRDAYTERLTKVEKLPPPPEDYLKRSIENLAEKWDKTLREWMRNIYAVYEDRFWNLVNYSNRKRKEKIEIQGYGKRISAVIFLLLLLTLPLFFSQKITALAALSLVPALSFFGLIIILLLFLLITRRKWF